MVLPRGVSLMVVWQSLPLEGKLGYMMSRASSAIVLHLAGFLVCRLAPAEPVHSTPFHSWTCSCASVADIPVLMLP